MAEHFASTPATETVCVRCGRPVLVALDEGAPARVNPQPISRDEEIRALCAGWWTYTLTHHRQLVHREPERIRGNSPRGTIHVQHECDPPRGITEERGKTPVPQQIAATLF